MVRVLIALVACATFAIPATAAATDLGALCVDPVHHFSVRYPSDWWVHPADPTQEIDHCQLFARHPFEPTLSAEGVRIGEQVAIAWVEACVGDIVSPKSSQELEIDGHPAMRRVYEPTQIGGSTFPGIGMTVYWIEINGEHCESADSRMIVASTSDTGASYAANVAVLDAMMRTLHLDVPDTAMPRSSPPMSIILGCLLVVTGLLFATLRYSQPRLRK